MSYQIEKNSSAADDGRVPARKIKSNFVAKVMSSEDLANTILSDIGETSVSLSIKKSQLDNQRSDTGKSSASVKLQEIKVCDEALSELLTEKSIVENKLSEIEKQITAVTTKRDILRKDYVSISSDQMDKMTKIAAARNDVSRAEILDSNVSSVTSSFRCLDSNVKEIEEELFAFLGAPGSNHGDALSLESLVSNSLDTKKLSLQVTEAFNNYVSAECGCIEALVNRVLDLRSKQTSKNREIVEYQRIGIEALVTELQKDLEKLESDCSEDINAIRGLQECLVEVIKSTLTPADLIAADKLRSASTWATSRSIVGALNGFMTSSEVPIHTILIKFGHVSLTVSPKAQDSPLAVQTKEEKPIGSAWGEKEAIDNSSFMKDKQIKDVPSTGTPKDSADAPLPKRSARSLRNSNKK